MSRYACLVCRDSKEMVFLGKAVFSSGGRLVNRFHRGGVDDPRNSQRETLNRVLWRFLAKNARKQVEVLLDDDLDSVPGLEDYRMIGGDSENDISVAEYLRDWEG